MPDPICPFCETPCLIEVRPYAYHGIYLGRFEFLVCPVEGRVFHPLSTSAAIEAIAREKGLFPPEHETTVNAVQLPTVRLVPKLETTEPVTQDTLSEGGPPQSDDALSEGKPRRVNRPKVILKPEALASQTAA